MLTYEAATQIAWSYIQKINDSHVDYDPVYLAYLRKDDLTYNQQRVTLVLTELREESFGWVFFYDSKEFLETGDFSMALAGNAPILIDKMTGELTVTGTAYSIEYYIEHYKAKLGLV